MAALPGAIRSGVMQDYQAWFSSDPADAKLYTVAQHNGSTATARAMLKILGRAEARGAGPVLGAASSMLDVGGGSGAFSYVFAAAAPQLNCIVLELPEVCEAGLAIRAEQPAEVQKRIRFREFDVSHPLWPVTEARADVVLMSYISGSVPAPAVAALYREAHRALRPAGWLLVHDFMVDDTLDGPLLGALWAFQHVAVNPSGLGLTPAGVLSRMTAAGLDVNAGEIVEMIGGMTKLITAQKPAGAE